VDNELSVIRFRKVMKRWLKTIWSILKGRYFVGKKDCPFNIEFVHWERLKVYWSKLEMEK
jgi:hypothetical protein